MYCPLTACLSGGGQGPLRFLALVSLIRPRKCFFFFSHWHLHIVSAFLLHVGALGFDK